MVMGGPTKGATDACRNAFATQDPIYESPRCEADSAGHDIEVVGDIADESRHRWHVDVPVNDVRAERELLHDDADVVGEARKDALANPVHVPLVHVVLDLEGEEVAHSVEP